MKYKVNHNQDLKETVLKTLKEVVESGEVDPWLKQDEIEKSWDNPNMSLNLPLFSLDDTGKENFETKLADKAQEKYNTSMYPDSYHNLPDENLNVQDIHGKLAMDAMSDKPYKREFGRTRRGTQADTIKAAQEYHEQKESSKRNTLNEDADTQWKSELKAFMNGLRSGNYFVENDTVYVQIWKKWTEENDPRYVYFRKGDTCLHDDHFYMQDSPKLSRRTINVINNRLGWADESDFYEQKQRIRGIAKKICEELLTDNDADSPAGDNAMTPWKDKYGLEGKTLTLTSRGGSFTAKVTYDDFSYPKGIRLYAEIGHTPIIITLSEDEYYNLVRGEHGTANAMFKAENNNLPPTDCTLRVN